MGKITAHLKKYFRCDNILHRKYVPLPQNKIYNRKERDKATNEGKYVFHQIRRNDRVLAKIIGNCATLFLTFSLSLCQILKVIEYGYQSVEQICLARRDHSSSKEQGWHHPEGDSKQVVGL